MSRMTNQSHSRQYVHPSEVEYFQALGPDKLFLYNVIKKTKLKKEPEKKIPYNRCKIYIIIIREPYSVVSTR
jgi:hypothetical protein